MPKKSAILESISEDDYSMVIVMKEDGERLYYHQFEDELSALDFLEQMVSAFRIDMIETALRRSVN